MNKTVITANGIGKSYMIGHQQKDQYATLREALARVPGQLWSRLCNPQYNTHENIEEFWALKDIDFEIHEGEKIGIIGRNGAGKSTLLKILSRITEPTTGKVKINGRVASLLEVGTGFHPELTGRENIFLNGAILGMSRSDIKMKFDEIVAFSEVEKFLDTPVKRYSSGMSVRLAFAVAAHLDPDILVVDEVLAVGDYEFQKKCLGKMHEVGGKGRTIIFVSHNVQAIKELCSKCIYMRNGQIEYFGQMDTAIEQYLKLKNPKKYSKRIGYSVDSKALKTSKVEGMEVIDIEILNIKNPGFPVASGDDIKIRIHYQSSQQFVAPVFALNFNDTNGFEIFRLSTMPISGYPIDNLFSNGLVELTLYNIPLVKGTYYLNLGFARESIDWYFYTSNLVKLTIEGKDIYHSGLELDRSRGVIWTNHKWGHREIHNNEKISANENSSNAVNK